jgi:hypothetical protein
LTNLWQALLFLSSIMIFQLKFTNFHVHVISCNELFFLRKSCKELTTDIKQHYTVIYLTQGAGRTRASTDVSFSLMLIPNSFA